MEREEKIRRLCEGLGVSQKAAQTALEQTSDDLLDAAALLELGRDPELCRVGRYTTPQRDTPPAPVPAPEPQGEFGARLWQFFRGILTHPLANGLEVRTRERVVTTVPAGVLAALVIVAFWVTVGLLCLGVLTGCRFTLLGPDWDIPQWNTVLADARGWLVRKLGRKR